MEYLFNLYLWAELKQISPFKLMAQTWSRRWLSDAPYCPQGWTTARIKCVLDSAFKVWNKLTIRFQKVWQFFTCNSAFSIPILFYCFIKNLDSFLFKIWEVQIILTLQIAFSTIFKESLKNTASRFMADIYVISHGTKTGTKLSVFSFSSYGVTMDYLSINCGCHVNAAYRQLPSSWNYDIRAGKLIKKENQTFNLKFRKLFNNFYIVKFGI